MIFCKAAQAGAGFCRIDSGRRIFQASGAGKACSGGSVGMGKCAPRPNQHWARRCTTSTPAPCRRDHPRMCGEKPRHATRSSAPLGSPPHVRGKAGNGGYDGLDVGITPACAGKRKSLDDFYFPALDQTRMRREKENNTHKQNI